jgi:serine/threonine-protein kinase
MLESADNQRRFSGTEGGTYPFFSPDGQWIGFFADGKMKKISVQGGAPVTLCPTPATARGAYWGEDGNIIANIDLVNLVRVPAAGGGTPQIIAKPADKGLSSYRFPQLLPGGEVVLLSAGAVGDFEDGSIVALALKTGDLKFIVRGGYFGRYLPSHHLIYVHQGALYAVRFGRGRSVASLIFSDQLRRRAEAEVSVNLQQTIAACAHTARSRRFRCGAL